ncbi:MAG TPA: AAA family ATPase [Candidatus Sulfotelmatobacter sp.]|nr:AAA family ATPase [Candidatus Sulfotelmatobacter sp.]
MYLTHFGLERAPFDITPQADDLFETPTHNEALAALVYGVLEGKGFVALTGEVGVGKTTVLRRALQLIAGFDPKLIAIEIANPTLAPATLVTRIHRTLRLPVDPAQDGDLQALRTALARFAAEGWRVVLVIDEAQNMSAAGLEFVRILSNLNDGGRPLIQIVLSGQPELEATLDAAGQRALRQRIAVWARIRPLTRRQSAAYVRFRLHQAGGQSGRVLTRAAIRRIVAHALGFPRRINIIADNVLLAAFAAGRRPADRRAVARAVATLGDRPRRRGWRLGWRTALPTSAALAVAAAVAGWAALSSPSGDPTAQSAWRSAHEPVVAIGAAPEPAVSAPSATP